MIPKTYVKSAIQVKIAASEPHEGDAFQEPIAVARSLEEFEAFNKVISSWEREYLLLNV